MQIVITGNGKSGSWKIRGEQLGKAIGARVIPNARKDDLKNTDVCICVKKPNSSSVNFENNVFDAVDCWPQPFFKTNLLSCVKEKTHLFKSTIAATRKMQEDIGADFWLRHHYRPGIEENQIRKDVRLVGYEGAAHYITDWLPAILKECKAMGWRLEVNPSSLAKCDLILGVRGGEWRNYATDNWKSGVKFSNAIGSLTPFIALPEAGYEEYDMPFERVDKMQDLGAAFKRLADFNEREKMANSYKENKERFSIDAVSKEYLLWLKTKF